MAVQRPASNSAAARNRSLGGAEPSIPDHADQPRRSADRSSRIQSRCRLDGAPGRDQRRRCAHDGCRGRRRLSAKPRRQPAHRRERARVRHGQHRFRRNGSRYAAHQSDAFPVVLSGEADVFSGGRRYFFVRPWAWRGCHSLLQSADRSDRRERSADFGRRQRERKDRRQQLRRPGDWHQERARRDR